MNTYTHACTRTHSRIRTYTHTSLVHIHTCILARSYTQSDVMHKLLNASEAPPKEKHVRSESPRPQAVTRCGVRDNQHCFVA